MAYLCEHIVTPAGDRFPMVGALRRGGREPPSDKPETHVRHTRRQKCWLGGPGRRIRGYLNGNWLLEPTPDVKGLVRESGHQRDLVARYNAIGSRMHLNFVSQPNVLQSFLRPVAEPQGILLKMPPDRNRS